MKHHTRSFCSEDLWEADGLWPTRTSGAGDTYNEIRETWFKRRWYSQFCFLWKAGRKYPCYWWGRSRSWSCQKGRWSSRAPGAWCALAGGKDVRATQEGHPDRGGYHSPWRELWSLRCRHRWPVRPTERESSRNTSFGLWSPETITDGGEGWKYYNWCSLFREVVSHNFSTEMCLWPCHPFKTVFWGPLCASADYPLGGASALWLNSLLICRLSPAPVLLSQGWLQTPSFFPVDKHTSHKHKSHTHTHTHTHTHSLNMLSPSHLSLKTFVS